jgi:hypothetical protein
MFHKRKDPNKVSRAYLYSAIVKNEGAEFCYFTARNVNFKEKTIKGKYYEDGVWKEKIFPFPDVIINAANQNTPRQDLAERKLKELIPFTSYPVGTKTSVYRRIIKGGKFAEHVIPYRFIRANQDVYDFLKLYGRVILKPIRGHHGNDVISITEQNGTYLIHEKLKTRNCYRFELDDYLDRLRHKQRFLVQKYINSRLRTGEPYDFRLHLQKNRQGKWTITIIFPRVGSVNRIITNLSQGSQMVELPRFLIHEFGDEAEFVEKMLRDFSLNFINHFESLYPYRFDELALDVGLDEDRKIWIYEVNWRPGHVFIEVKTARNAIDYAMFLAKQEKEKYEKVKTE